MLVLIQISHADAHLAKQMGEVLTKLGPYRGHKALITFTQDVSATDAMGLRRVLEPLFDSVEAQQIQTSSKQWPLGSNQSFQASAKLAAQIGLPWLNLELDCTPTRVGWLDEVAAEYASEGKPFMGAVVPTRGKVLMADGSYEPLTDGTHMVGWGVYPAEFAYRSVKLPTVAVIMRWGAGSLEPYDLQLRHETLNCHNSDLFQHNFRTVNYRLNEDKTQIVCDNAPGNPETANHAKPVDSRAALVHGCKDGSLAQLILSGAQVPKTIPVLTTSQEVAAPGGNGAEVSTSPSPDVPGKERHSPRSFKAHQIHKLLGDGKGRRVPTLAMEMNIPEPDIRQTIAEESSGLEVVMPGGWVKVSSPSQ